MNAAGFARVARNVIGCAVWRGVRVPLYVCEASDGGGALGKTAFNSCSAENVLGARRAFASIRGMEEGAPTRASVFSRPRDGAARLMASGRTAQMQTIATPQVRSCETVPHVITGLFFQPAAFGARLRGVPERRAFVAWNIVTP